MQGLVIAIPLLLFFGFIPFSVIMEEIFGQSLFFFMVMMVYVIVLMVIVAHNVKHMTIVLELYV